MVSISGRMTKLEKDQQDKETTDWLGIRHEKIWIRGQGRDASVPLIIASIGPLWTNCGMKYDSGTVCETVGDAGSSIRSRLTNTVTLTDIRNLENSIFPSPLNHLSLQSVIFIFSF